MREDMVDSEDELSAWRDLQSGATTPNVQEAVENLKRSLSFSTLHEMSTNPSSELRRNLQNKLWRPKDEEARLPSDWERLLVHVVRAGARAFMLAYGLRSSISALLALIKSLRSRCVYGLTQARIRYLRAQGSLHRRGYDPVRAHVRSLVELVQVCEQRPSSHDPYAKEFDAECAASHQDGAGAGDGL